MARMRWQCGQSGCFIACRPQLDMFDGCFPVGNMGDLDGILELGGHFLVVEFKRPGVVVPYGQQRMFEKLVATKLFTVIVVRASGQDVQAWTVFDANGRRSVDGDLTALRTEVKAWAHAHDPRPVAA